MSDFHEVLFPVDISYGSQGGPKWKTSVWQADSGFEARVADWENTRAEYDVSHGIKSSYQMDALTSFFMGRFGRAYGFRFKDWNDYETDDIFLGYGDYATCTFQITKTYNSPDHDGTAREYERKLIKIDWGSESGVKIDGLTITKDPGDFSHYSINYNAGLLATNFPMKGAWYGGITPATPIDFITTGEGGHATNYLDMTQYDSVAGLAFQNAKFTGLSHDDGVRKFNIETAAEVSQHTMDDMNIPVIGDVSVYSNNDMSGLICASTDGFLYMNTGGVNNACAIAKVRTDTMQFVTGWGRIGVFPDETSSDYPSAPGCVSLNNEFFVHFGIFGGVDLHRASTCEKVKTLVDTGNVAFNGHVGACPYNASGFGILYNGAGQSDGDAALFLYLGGGDGYNAMYFGGEGGQAVSAHYDQKTGGILLFWTGDTSGPDTEVFSTWCGLYHEEAGGFRWKRRIPAFLAGSGRLNMQVPLNGQMVWASSATYFGWCMWILDTETGQLSARRTIEDSGLRPGNFQTFDPSRELLLTMNTKEYVISTAVIGTPDPPQELTLDHAEFHVPVRFDTDHLNVKHEFWTYKSWESIPLVEVRNWDDLELD